MFPTVSHAALENTLRKLTTIGTRVEDDSNPAREVWRFVHDGKPYRLHFYFRGGVGNPALKELQSFQLLQKAGVRSPRAISAMVGFRLGSATGDALLLESIEPATDLKRLLINCELEATPIPHRAQLLNQLIEILQQLAKSGLAHERLAISSFIVRDETLYLAEATGVRGGGLHIKQLMRLAHSAHRFTTRSDLVRVATMLGAANVDPAKPLYSKSIWRPVTAGVFGDNKDFGTLADGEWSGVFSRRAAHPVRWASASRETIERTEWQRAWPELLSRIRAGQLQSIKDDPSGAVLRATVRLNDKEFNVIVKSPRRKTWRQTIGQLFRFSRARRTWLRTWQMLMRGLPCEWPMLLMERRRAGYPLESFIVFQEVPGSTLASIDLDSLHERERETLFRRAGRSLRLIEQFGFTHGDAKSTNWIVFNDSANGPRPVLIDLYGVRNYPTAMWGIERLLRAMRQHPQYTPVDSMHLCLGYAPRAKLARDKLADTEDLQE